MAALDRAIDPTRPPEDRKMVLRFLKTAAGDPAVERWAGDELKVVQDEIDSLRKVVTDLKKEVATRKANEDSLTRTLAEKHSPKEHYRYRQQYESEHAARTEAESELAELRARNTDSGSVLHSSPTSSVFTSPTISGNLTWPGGSVLDPAPSLLKGVAPIVSPTISDSLFK
jgi:hypothetical protein